MSTSCSFFALFTNVLTRRTIRHTRNKPKKWTSVVVVVVGGGGGGGGGGELGIFSHEVHVRASPVLFYYYYAYDYYYYYYYYHYY